MPRYYFHVVSPRNPVRDAHGVELAGLDAAHWHAMHLVYRLREHAPETGEDWVIEVSDETGARPLVVLPRAVPMLRATITPAELGGSLSNLGGDPGERHRGARQKSRDPPHLFVILAYAGIQRAKRKMQNWIPAFAGMTRALDPRRYFFAVSSGPDSFSTGKSCAETLTPQAAVVSTMPAQKMMVTPEAKEAAAASAVPDRSRMTTPPLSLGRACHGGS